MQELIWSYIPRPWGGKVPASLMLMYFDGKICKHRGDCICQSSVLGRPRTLGIRRHPCKWDPEAGKLLLQPLPPLLLPSLGVSPIALRANQWHMTSSDNSSRKMAPASSPPSKPCTSAPHWPNGIHIQNPSCKRSCEIELLAFSSAWYIGRYVEEGRNGNWVSKDAVKHNHESRVLSSWTWLAHGMPCDSQNTAILLSTCRAEGHALSRYRLKWKWTFSP